MMERLTGLINSAAKVSATPNVYRWHSCDGGEVLDNARYRAVTGITDGRVATYELQDLVARELVDQVGVKSGSKYVLSDFARLVGHDRRRPRPNRRRQITQALELRGTLSKAELVELTRVSEKTVEHWLRQMKKDGEVEIAQGGRASKNTEYRLTARALQQSLPLADGE